MPILNKPTTTAKPTTTEAPTTAKPTRKPTAKRTRKPTTEAPATDAATNASSVSHTESIATDRSVARSFFATLDAASVSIPVKSFAAFKRSYKRDITALDGSRATTRGAAAAAAAFVCAGIKLADGATAPRRFTYNGRELAIENGGLQRAIAGGLCTYNGADDTITLRNVAEIRSKLGKAVSGA